MGLSKPKLKFYFFNSNALRNIIIFIITKWCITDSQRTPCYENEIMNYLAI